MRGARSLSFIGGLALGAGLLYFAGHDGRRHRALIREKTQHWGNRVVRVMDVGFRDLFNRSQGIFAKLVSAILPEFGLDDATLEARVKSETGRCLSHPRVVQVLSNRRHITLRGPIPLTEFDGFHDAVRSVKGVKSVNSEMELVLNPELHPALQGPAKESKKISRVQRTIKTPSVRLLASGAGVGLIGAGVNAWLSRKRDQELHHSREVYPDDLDSRSGRRVERDKAPVPRDFYSTTSPGLPH